MRRLTATLCIVAGPAVAGSFTPPIGCSAYLTVQSSNCTVEHHYTCEADAPGEKWHTELDQDGQIYVGKVDDEAQWLDSYYVRSQERESLSAPAPDPASLTTLFATDIDTYEFYINTANGRHRVSGFDRIAEANVVIDGEVLHRTEYVIEITNRKGEVTYAASGSEYVSQKYRRYFSGYGDVTAPDAPYSYRSVPIEFIYPDEKGFLENTPIYGCNVQSARAVIQ